MTIANPGITIEKTPNGPVAGPVVSFDITVTNTGDLRLKDVTVTDTEIPGCSLTAQQVRDTLNTNNNVPVFFWLVPGETFTYPCIVELPDGEFTNNVSTEGETEGGVPVNDADSATVDVGAI